MEYEALINRILEAEQTAREITREAHEKQAHMEESLKQEEARIKADYLARADQRLEQRRERPFSREELAVLFAAMLMEE